MVKLLASYNDEVAKTVWDNAPQNGKYTSHKCSTKLQEVNSRFSAQAMNSLTLSCALNPKGGYRAFNIDTICTLVETYYPMDFYEQDKITFPFQLPLFLVDARQSTDLKNLSTVQILCSCLVATNRDKVYFLIDRLLRLIMTLPVSTATTERSFSAMKIIKTKLQNKMRGRFLAYSMFTLKEMLLQVLVQILLLTISSRSIYIEWHFKVCSLII
ncbi:unnamed protein product [Trifolium pratense]|uniref:Uncharacterized protein n=1 Tax=Trifolium pratense TaxID=57577 RepID=A0ACB0LBR5_TRIPR|nr:unnamed protein product [Trifolium pratense]